MNRSLAILAAGALLTATAAAPITTLAAVRCVPIGPQTHYQDHGYYRERTWLHVASPLLQAGMVEEDWLFDAGLIGESVRLCS